MLYCILLPLLVRNAYYIFDGLLEMCMNKGWLLISKTKLILQSDEHWEYTITYQCYYNAGTFVFFNH